MKKVFRLGLLLALIVPFMQVKADGKIIIACDEALTQTSGQCQKVQNGSETTVTYYIGAETTTGISKLEGTWKLTNLKGLKTAKAAEGWTLVSGKSLDVQVTSATAKTGKFLIATFTFIAEDNGEDCSAVFEVATNTTPQSCTYDSTTKVYYGKNGTAVDQATYNKECNSCKQENGKYYGSEGVEVTKEEYDAQCSTVENPKTGISAPYIAIGAGIVVIGLLYIGLRKKGSVYKI